MLLSLRGGGEGDGTGVVSSRSKIGPGDASGAGVAATLRREAEAPDAEESGSPCFAAELSPAAVAQLVGSMANECLDRCAADFGDVRGCCWCAEEGAANAAAAACSEVACAAGSIASVRACLRREDACGGGCA